MNIPQEPVTYVVIGLSAIILLVLFLPLRFKFIERNLELFFLVTGVIAVSVAGLWNKTLVIDALKAPVIIGSLPIGIFQVVLIVGLIIFYFNRHFYRGITAIAARLGPRLFIFTVILVLGLVSSVISVILTSVILAEIISVLPFPKTAKIKLAVVTCFAMGLGAVLTPLGEPLSTILVHKLSGAPYFADFFYPVQHFMVYVGPGVLAAAVFGAFYIGRDLTVETKGPVPEFIESLKSVIIRAFRVYFFVAALVLLGEGLKPMIVWYFTDIPDWALYWINSVSAVLDNATLTAVEIGPTMHISQIITAVMGLLIAGGMLIPGNIPNIVAAGRLKITMKEWAIIGVPIGLLLMAIYFAVLIPQMSF